MFKIIGIAVLWSLIILDSEAQNSFLTKTETNDDRTLYVKIKRNVSEEEFLIHLFALEGMPSKACRAERAFPASKDVELSRIYKVTIAMRGYSRPLLEKFKSWAGTEFVEYAQIYKTSAVPNDWNVRQWHLRKIDAFNAFDLRTGSPQILVAIVDDAIDCKHEDLLPNIKSNASEIDGNGIDDDNNGYIDDHYGWNACYQKGNASPPFQNRRDFAHGTHCAGIADAATNNGIGIASIGSNVMIIPVACADSSNPGYVVNGYEGVVYAIDNGADVISLSWGGSNYSSLGQNVMNYAASKNVVVVAAAGNSNTNIKMYPAAFNGVIAVAAVDSFDKKAAFSNFGTWVDVSAPGVDIYSSVTGKGFTKYDYMSGTSMACPMVAGLCALMLSQNNTLSPSEIEACLKSTADNIAAQNSGFGNMLGAGRVNARKALQCIKPLFADFDASASDVCPGQSVNFTSIVNYSVNSYSWYINQSKLAFSTLKNPQYTFAANGAYSVKLVVSDGVNKDSMTKVITVRTPSAALVVKTTTIRVGDQAILELVLNGRPPFNVSINDGIQNATYPNITTSPYFVNVSPSAKTIYRLTSMNDAKCSGNVKDSVIVLVDTSKIYSGGGSNSCAKFNLYGKGIDLGYNEQPHHICTLKDGNIAIAGLSNVSSIGGADIFLVKANPEGDIIWVKYYGTSASELGAPLGVFDDDDYNLYIYAGTSSSQQSGLLIKTDSSGTVLYSKVAINAKVQDLVRTGMQLSDGRILLGGTSGITADQAGELYTMSKSGTTGWSQTFDFSGTTEHIISVREHNKAIYALGHTSQSADNYATYMVKTRLDGTKVWQKYIEFSFWDAGISHIITSKSTIMCMAWMSYSGASRFGTRDFGIIHLDTNGNKIWSRIIGTTGSDIAFGIAEINGNYYITGTTDAYDGGKSKLFVSMIDFNGNLQWTKIYGSTGETITMPSFAKNLTLTKDGGLVMFGMKSSTNQDILLMKIDECGNSSCETQTVTFKSASDNKAFVNSNLNDLGILAINPISISKNNVSTSSIKRSVICTTKIPKPDCEFTPNYSYEFKCFQDGVKFKDFSSLKGNTKIKYRQWLFPDSSMAFGDSVIKRFTKSGSYKVRLILYADTPLLCSKSIDINVDVKMLMTARLKASSVTQCIDDSVKLQVIPECGVAPYKIQWMPSVLFNDPSLPTNVVSIKSTGWIRCRVMDSQGSVYDDSVFISLDPSCCRYKATIKVLKENICLGEAANFSISNAPSGVNFNWYFYHNSVLVDALNGPVNSYKPNNPGLYQLKVILSGACKNDTVNLSFFVYPLPIANAGNDTMVCSSAVLKFGTSAFPDYDYQWTGDTLGISKTDSALITVPVNNSRRLNLIVRDRLTQCVSQDSLLIVFGNNDLSLGNDTTLCEGRSMDIWAGSSIFNTKYLWNNGETKSGIRISNPGMYVVTKSNACGSISDTIVVSYKLCFCELFLPNAFSPDANAINDYFPERDLDTTIDIRIFNRWGEKIYEAFNTSTGWDGRYKGEIVQQEVYLYIIRYRNCYGRYVYRHGTFTLLR